MPKKFESILSGLKQIFIAIVLAIASVAGFAVLAIVALWALGKAGTVETYYRCPGTMETTLGSGQFEKSTTFLRLQSYRPFLFWADDDGMLWVETMPQDDFLLLQKMTVNNDMFFSFTDSGANVDMSKNSLIVRMALPGKRHFTGECTQTDR